jgi:hypothetical protein
MTQTIPNRELCRSSWLITCCRWQQGQPGHLSKLQRYLTMISPPNTNLLIYLRAVITAEPKVSFAGTDLLPSNWDVG